MTGLPTVQVLLDDGSGAFPFDITGKVLIGPGVSFSRGRQDWQGGVTSGAVSLTLNNADGRFTPGSTVLASPSPIKVDQRIRVKETINGTAYTRFTGYVKSWPVGWPATVSSWSTVQIVATDAQARAERRVLKSVIDEEILADSPAGHWPLGEASGSTSASDATGLASTLTPIGSGAAVAFGSAAGALTAVAFANGQWLQGAANLPTGTIAAFVCAFATTTAPAANTSLLLSVVPGQDLISINTAGKLIGPAGLISPNAVTDGVLHVAEVRYSGTTVYLVLDGVAVASAASATTGLTVSAIQVGQLYTGTIAHVALFPTDPGATRATAHATAMLTGFAGESGATRLTRTAGYAGLPVGTFDASLTEVAYVDIAGKAAWEALQQVADAEMGVVFIDGSGNLTFHNRNRPAAKTAPDLTLMSSYIAPDVQPVTDDQQITNYIEGTAAGTGAMQVVRSTTSETAHGRYPTSVEYLVQSDQEVLDRAKWIIANFAESTTRYGTLSINLYAMTAAQASAVLAAIEIDAWLRIVAMPSQNTTGATADVVVEGYAEEATASSWKLTCNVVSKSLTDVLILDDSTRGVLDAGNRLYV